MPKNRLLPVLIIVFLAAAALVVLGVNKGWTSAPASLPAPSQAAALVAPSGAVAGTPVPPTLTGTAVPSLTPTPTMTLTSSPSPTPSETPFAATPIGQDGKWKIVFNDEFDGAALDLQKWTTCFWWAKGGCTIATNKELQWYQPQNISIKDGALVLSATAQQVTSPDGKSFPYTSGMVSSGRESDHSQDQPRFSFTYGYTEIRAWVPAGAGLLPAFWMLPITNVSNPEIDIMEVLGQEPDSVEMHFHYKEANGQENNYGDSWKGPDFSTGWHTFGLDWQPDRLVWYVDGQERMHFDGPPAYIPAQPMYLLLNLAVGGNWPGNPNSSTVFPSLFKIDYLRVWQPADTEVLSPTADTYIDSSHPDQNYDQSAELFSDTSPEKITYIQYDATALKGRTILSAKLRFTTTEETGSPSPNSHEVILLDDNNWTKVKLTYQNSLEENGQVLGKIPPTDKPMQVYETPLDAGLLQPRLGSVFSLSIRSDGDDGLYLYSKESALGGVQLVLSLSPL